MSNLIKPWEKISREVVYDSYIKILRDRVLLPSGKEILYDSIDQGDCSCALLLTSENKIVLLRQYRYVLGEITWEIPMGGVEKNETPEDAAYREILEETGYVITNLRPLGIIVPSNGQSPQKMHLFFAVIDVNARKSPSPEDTEFLEVHHIDTDKIKHMIKDGLITDAATLTAILLAEREGFLI